VARKINNGNIEEEGENGDCPSNNLREATIVPRAIQYRSCFTKH